MGYHGWNLIPNFFKIEEFGKHIFCRVFFSDQCYCNEISFWNYCGIPDCFGMGHINMNNISEVIHTSQGYVVFKLEVISPEGFQPLEDVKTICENRIKRKKQKDLAKQIAIKIQQQLNNNKSFTDIVNNDTSTKIKMDSTNNFTMQRNDPKIGRAPEVTAAAFTLDIGQTSNILESDRGYFIVKVIERDNFNEEEYKNQRLQIRNQLLSRKVQQFFNSWYEKLKENADIEDNRNLFFSS